MSYHPRRGQLIEDVALTTGFNNVAHSLGRAPDGWRLVRDQQDAVNFIAYPSATQSVNSASTTLLQLNTVTGASTSGFNTGTYKWTVPHTGEYAVSWFSTLGSLADTKYFLAMLYVDGAFVSLGTQVANGAALNSAVGGSMSSWQFTADEVVDVRLYHTHGSARSTLAGSDNGFLSVQSIETLQDDQDNVGDATTTLRLYSARARTVSLEVF